MRTVKVELPQAVSAGHAPDGIDWSISRREVMATAKLFKNGRSQAVRLPKEFRFDGQAVSIRREGRRVVLEPLPRLKWPAGYWRSWGRHSRALEEVKPLRPGGGDVDLDDR
jgi:virulence-associated protein VagC